MATRTRSLPPTCAAVLGLTKYDAAAAVVAPVACRKRRRLMRRVMTGLLLGDGFLDNYQYLIATKMWTNINTTSATDRGKWIQSQLCSQKCIRACDSQSRRWLQKPSSAS